MLGGLNSTQRREGKKIQMHISDRYFLTERKKQKELSSLASCIEKGDVDKLMIPYLEQINKLPGVVTQFCCQGHRKYHDREGYITILLSERAFHRLYFGHYGGFDVMNVRPLVKYGTATIEFFYDSYGRFARSVLRFKISKRDEFLAAVVDHLKLRLGKKKVYRF